MRYDIEKMAVSVDPLDRAIGGDVGSVASAFWWVATPQGSPFWYDQDAGKTPLDIDALKDIKREYMHHTGTAGKLKDMHVKSGDVVRHCDGSEYTIKERLPGVLANWHNSGHGGWGVDVSESEQDYHLISLAEDAQPDTPKKWRDMTDAEKGALLLAAHDGKTIGVWDGDHWRWVDGPHKHVVCFDNAAYRVKPEPVRETVAMYGRNFDGEWSFGSMEPSEDTHRITFDTIDGNPDCSTIKMEPITKEESK